MKISENELERRLVTEYRSGLIYGFALGAIFGYSVCILLKSRRETNEQFNSSIVSRLDTLEKKTGIKQDFNEHIRDIEKESVKRFAADLRDIGGLVITEKDSK